MSDAEIYVIRHPDAYSTLSDHRFGYFKIGKATRVRTRMSRLQSGTPYNLELLTTIEPVGDPEAVEAAFHRLFYIERRRGEWFELHPAHVEDLCRLEKASTDDLLAVRDRVMKSYSSLFELPLLREIRAGSSVKKPNITNH